MTFFDVVLTICAYRIAETLLIAWMRKRVNRPRRWRRV